MESRRNSTLTISRRTFVAASLAGGLVSAIPGRASVVSIDRNILPQAMIARARAAMEAHGSAIIHRDRMAIADFSQPSRLPRFYLVDLAAGKAEAFLVSHGRGSDPAHSGWLERFSNLPGSNASSHGAYLTGDYYTGKHGRSQRLIGLDPSNDNAEARAIVIHGAWYVSEEMVRQHGKLGRSEGCFAFAEDRLDKVLELLGPGRLIYADKA
jgi:hypothetical protein